jgi:ribosome-binding ATPase YchF (GTP1/OBG family)
VAGLVPDAHIGKGLGNQFLSDLSRAKAFILVIDMSGELDESGNPGKSNPRDDIKWLFMELDLWIKGILEKNFRQIEIKSKQGRLVEALSKQLSGIRFGEDELEKAVKNIDFKKENLLEISKRLRLLRPVIVAANKMDRPGAGENLERCKEKFPDLVFVPTYAEGDLVIKKAKKAGLLEMEEGDLVIKGGNDAQKKALLRVKEVYDRLGKKTGVQDLIDATVKRLSLVYAFPVVDETHLTDKDNRVLPDVFLVPKGITAKQFAYRIHTDIGEKYIYALDARRKMKISQDYEIENGDIIKIASAA